MSYECDNCGATCTLRDGDDPTPNCDHYAHELLERAEQALRATHEMYCNGLECPICEWERTLNKPGVVKPLEGMHECPECGQPTRDTTAGCDHCEMDDK